MFEISILIHVVNIHPVARSIFRTVFHAGLTPSRKLTRLFLAESQTSRNYPQHLAGLTNLHTPIGIDDNQK